LRWTPDNRSLIVTATPTGARDGVVMRVPVDPKEAPTFYGRNDEWLFVSPDGKHVAYPAVRTLGTTIWRVDFVPPGGVGSSRKP
jgi:Tol biopolymer transport system component